MGKIKSFTCKALTLYSGAFVLLLVCSMWQGYAFSGQRSISQEATNNRPYFQKGDPIYADIDTANQRVYVLLKEGLWCYELESKQWELLARYDSYPEPMLSLEFGFDPYMNRLLLWSRGVGTMYEINMEDYNLERIDRSFPHKNQFGHFPFFHDGELHAFGGYGFWEDKEIITFFNSSIQEWNIVTVSKNSGFPQERRPFTGTYLSDKEEFYFFGGSLFKGGRPDDKNVIRTTKQDIWRFSFRTATWEKVDDLDGKAWKYYRAASPGRFGSVNSISGSFYSNDTGNWYLPVELEDTPSAIYFLMPYNIKQQTEYKPLEIPLGDSREFIISNYLFDGKNNRMVLVGLDHLTNTRTLPVRIVTIAEDSLLTNLVTDSEENITFVVGSLFAVGGIFFIAILILKSRPWEQLKKENNHVDKDKLLREDWLNETERKLIEVLWNEGTFLETSVLEEMVWSEIENYDYRRKLRNETIKSINEKFSLEFSTEGKLILRKTDSEDQRRFRYGLNEKVIGKRLFDKKI